MPPFAMRFPLLAAIIFATNGMASEPSIEDACVRAAEHYFQTDRLKPSKVQSFPELSPPRVRMHLSGPGLSEIGTDKIAALLGGRTTDISPSATIGPVMCEFENDEAPFVLVNFDCAGIECFPAPDRVEEIRVLLHREGL